MAEGSGAGGAVFVLGDFGDGGLVLVRDICGGGASRVAARRFVGGAGGAAGVFSAAVAIVGVASIDGVILSVAGADGNYVG